MSWRVGKRPVSLAHRDAVVAALSHCSVSTLGHLTDFGYAIGLQPLCRPSRAIGPAFTVRIPHLDGTALHYAVDLVQPGDVLVIDTAGERARACWGGVVAAAAAKAGVVGVIVDGPVTDWEQITVSGPPVWCRGVSALTTRVPRLEGAVLVPVQVGGAVVRPGDIVFADSDGVFFIASEFASETADALAAQEAAEADIGRRLESGETLGHVTGAYSVMHEAVSGGAR